MIFNKIWTAVGLLLIAISFIVGDHKGAYEVFLCLMMFWVGFAQGRITK